MAQKPVGGVAGVLGGLISVPATADHGPIAKKDAPADTLNATASQNPRPSAKRPRARLGRPPATALPQLPKKEKFTVRVDSDLAAAYRDWSWEARCQVGELVQQALRSYLSQRRK